MRKTRVKALKALVPESNIDQIAMKTEQTMKKDENGVFRVRYEYTLTNAFKNVLRKLKKEWNKNERT